MRNRIVYQTSTEVARQKHTRMAAFNRIAAASKKETNR